MVLASEETGQVSDILCMLGQISPEGDAGARGGSSTSPSRPPTTTTAAPAPLGGGRSQRRNPGRVP